MSGIRPLVPLHPDNRWISSKQDEYRKLSTDLLIDALQPGRSVALKARPNGTPTDGHRVKVLRECGVDMNALPRRSDS